MADVASGLSGAALLNFSMTDVPRHCDVQRMDGHADADIDRALQENPPRSHEVHGSLDYVHAADGVGSITEDELNRQFRLLWKGASPCVKRAAKILQFT